jgi:RNA polymerase sigma-B factor
VQKVSSHLQASLGRIPTNREIADECGVSEDAVSDVFATQEMIRVASLDAPGPDGEDTEVERLDSAESGTAQISVEDRVVLFEAMTQLRELERNVVVLFHFESLSQAEIANRLSISCNYVSHILRQSHGKLRTILGPRQSERLAPAWATGDGGETVDTLTGCYTEAYLHARLTEELHRLSSQGGTLSLVTVEFEGFDSYGQFYGDDSVRQALADAAEQIRSASRSLDVVCRLGDTGFAVILPGTGSASSIVRDRIAGKFSSWAAEGQGRVTAKIGSAVGSRALGGASEFIAAARNNAVRGQEAA